MDCMIMGRSISQGQPIAMLCYPKSVTGDKTLFVLAEGFRIDNGEPVWESAQEFNDFNTALQAWFGYERVGLRSVANMETVIS